MLLCLKCTELYSQYIYIFCLVRVWNDYEYVSSVLSANFESMRIMSYDCIVKYKYTAVRNFAC